MFQTRDWFCGHLRAIGHGKDVIIRGGDNIPVVEVESLLCRHPANAMAAIVAYPDERLGEAGEAICGLAGALWAAPPGRARARLAGAPNAIFGGFSGPTGGLAAIGPARGHWFR